MKKLQPLINKLSNEVHHLAVVAALLQRIPKWHQARLERCGFLGLTTFSALKGHFRAIESDDDRGINESRGLACEVVAWQFVLTLSEREALDYLLFELHKPGENDEDDSDDEESRVSRGRANGSGQHSNGEPTERTGLLSGGHTPGHGTANGNGAANGNGNGNRTKSRSSSRSINRHIPGEEYEATGGEGFAEPFLNLNTLEIAAVANAKKFLSQRAIQEIINGIWSGEIVFWEALKVHAVKKPKYYNKNLGDPWCRLRVPRYMKTYEIVFFLCFLGLFYVVSIQRNMESITVWEIVFYLFVAGFAFDEWSEFVEAGARFYATDIWSLWDIGIIIVGLVFFITRMIGLAQDNKQLLEVSFSILALHSLFLTPRIFSLLSLSPYYGTLLPCLKEMGKQIIRFLGFVLIIYLGFFTTFALLARGHVALRDTSITVLKVFFGGGVIGFDIAPKISPYLGLPVMIVFVCMTNQLLITSMMAYVNNSLRQVLDSSREEYLYVYSIYVLEASTSNKLAYFFPPFNLVPVVLFRPILMVLPERAARRARIVLLKATHAPFVGIIWCYEYWQGYVWKKNAARRETMGIEITNRTQAPSSSAAMPSRPVKTSLSGRSTAVPASLVQASKRNPQQLGRSGTVSLSSAARTGTFAPGSADGASASETMRLLKELSAQVEELRATVVKQQQGPGQ
ncbi:Ion transport [Macrophomina phaseolina MS6]|uniref:Ion transport n=1 Tax=Macrophomina phaseolina (strain MS6) TaxID=1126212 RepID=K2RFK1_MACPH|nr:Ion transport [Macrophomina phaseolina MS6]